MIVQAVQHTICSDVLLVVIWHAEQGHRVLVVHELISVRNDLVRPNQELQLGVLEELLNRLAAKLDGGASGEVKSNTFDFFRRIRPEHIGERVERLVVIKLRLLWVSETIETVYHINVKAGPARNASVHYVVRAVDLRGNWQRLEQLDKVREQLVCVLRILLPYLFLERILLAYRLDLVISSEHVQTFVVQQLEHQQRYNYFDREVPAVDVVSVEQIYDIVLRKPFL